MLKPLLSLAVALTLAVAATPALAAKKVALVIGNAAYNVPLAALPNSRNDADDVAAALEKLEFEVIRQTDLDLQGMLAAIDTFEARLDEDGIAIFYFSGHGMQYQQRNYLVPVGVPMASLDDVGSNGMPVDRVMAAITAKPRKFNLVILDACNDTGLETRDGQKLGGLARMDSPSNTLIAFAAGVGQLASAGWDRNSVFTGELLKNLATPQITVQEMLGRTRERVVELSKFAPIPQVPVDFNALTDQDFYLTLSWFAALQVFKDCETCPEMEVIPKGRYMRGSETGGRHERPVKEVTIGYDFAVATHEVTFAEWDECVADGVCKHRPDDKGWGRGQMPVINVSWDHTRQFLTWLSRKSGKRYRLPTEAEWEYAARAGGEGAQKGNWSSSQTRSVDQGDANAWGLVDMQGNVFEWVEDCMTSYLKAPTDGSAWANAVCGNMVVRGGSWQYGPEVATVSFRGDNPAYQIREDVGFRVARNLD